MLNSANVRIILVIKSQGMLFDMPIQVGSSVDKHGRFRQAHTRIQKVRAKELPSVREPIAEEIKPNTRLAAWLDKHGGIGSVAKIVAEAPDAAQAKMIDLMAGVGKLTPEQARKLLDSAIPNDSQADLFAQAPKATDGTDDLFSQPATVKGKWKLKSPPPAEESHAQATEAIETEPPKAPEEKPAAKLTEAQKVGAGETAKLDYEGFRKEYEELFNRMMSYSPNEVGSGIYADKMAKLSDDYPEFMDRFDRNDDEIHNLKRIKAINERQGLDLDVAGMASQTLKESGRLPEVFADVPSAQPVTAPPHGEAIQFGVQAGITKQARRDLNAQAVAIVQRGGPFSDDDKAILRQYSGNGGCGDSLNEYYTRQDVAAAMWVALQSMGVMGGSVLEPSCGPGVFLHTAPNSFKVTGVEMDGVSAQVAKALHGDRHEIQNASLERFAVQDNRQFDAVIGNVPFGLRGSLIRDDKPHLKTAEAYFCDTAMDKCKAGGIVGLIVPTGVMDSRTNRKLREMLLRKGQFLGAQRMPNTAFEHAHTEVTTDIIWLRKYPDDVSGALSSSPVGQSQLKSLGIWDDEFLSGSYFTGRGAANIHGSMEAGWRAKAGIGADITVTGSMKDVADSLAMFKPEVAAKIPTVPDIMDAVGADEKARAKVLGATMTRPYEKQGKAGDTKTVDGIAYVLQGRPLRWHRVDEVVQSEALIQGRDIAARIETLIAGSAPVDRDQLQKDLHAWVAAHGVPAKNKDVLLGAQQDKSLYRLIGAVNSQGELSDWVTGKAAKKVAGNFEATVQSLLNDHETAAVRSIALSAGIHEEEALDQLYGSPKYAIDPATGEWTTQDIYLSGDLWAKSDAAKESLTNIDLAPEMRSKLEKQSAMLMEAIAPVSLEDAFIQVNSAFLPTSILSSFLTWRNKEGPQARDWSKSLDPVEVTFADGVYTIEGGNKWGMQKDLDKYLNRTGLRKDDKHTIDDLNVEFKEWLCASPQYREQAEDLYNRKFRGFAEREFSNEPMDIPGMNTEGLKDYQWGTLRWALNAGKGIIASDVGLGKAQPLDAKILTPTGWKLMGEMRVGDEVIAGDGTVTHVTGVFPQGEKEIFRVTMSDGATTECCDEHLWLTQTTKERNNERRRLGESGKPKVRQLSDIRATLQNLGREKNHAIPMIGPVEFAARDVKIDPYLLGVLIGDGSLARCTPQISNPEPGIIEALRDKLPDGYALNKQATNGDRCASYNLCKSGTNTLPRNGFTSSIEGYGLNKLSNGKFVPDDYKYNTSDVRVAILQGLMDTDGYVDRRGVTVQFTSVSERLANDVKFLVNSIGGNATIKSKIPTFTYKGEKKQGQRAYTVHLRLPPSVSPFLHSVKRERVVPKSKYRPVRYIVAAESVGMKLAQCIAVAHESHLYVTDDFIVTHNTVASLMLVKTLVATGQANRPMIVVPKSVLSNWAAEAEKWFPGSKVLLIGADGDNAQERKRKYHDMQQNHYDFIIVSEPSFEELDLDPATKVEYNARDFWVQRGDRLGSAGDKRTNKIREAWNQSRAGQEFSGKDRTDATYFNQMGVDAIVYDEAHHTKNLVGVKSRFGESPKYLGGGGLSMRSLDFNLKSRWLMDHNNGKNVFLCTATPTKNSPLEIFSMISHVAPELFERIGVRNSEEFLDRFAKFENGMALDTGGTMKEALITAGFQNMDELRAIMKRAIRRKTADDVGLKLPQRQDVQHMIQMDDAQQAKYAELRELAAEAGSRDATGDSHIFSIMDKMNKAATDMSLLDSDYDATKSPKYVACAAEIVKNMKDGGQIVFSDYVDSHEKIAAALVASGIPRKQIGILNAKAASSSEKRQKIADDFNAGKLRVVIGNTAVMGEGLNLQKGTSDIHHLDLPWEPASMQQRNGRGLRQGNTNAGVRIHNYLARGSFDGYRLQAIMAKKDWQDAVWNGGNEVENLNKQDINREELMIMLAADPDQAREAYESNNKDKEARLIAGKTAESAQRFDKFQEIKRSFNAIKDKDTQSAIRLKAKMDKEYSALRADRYFTAKAALDMDQVIVNSSGVMLHSGAGIDLGDEGRYVVTEVDPRKGDVSMRRYGDETGLFKRVIAARDIAKIKPFAFSKDEENEEIARKIASKPLEIKSMDDVYKLPDGAINANRDKIQAQLWEGLRNYSIHSYGVIPLIEKSTGKVVTANSYDVTSKSPKYSEAEYDILTPTIENKAKLLEAWKDAERKAEFSTQHYQAKRGKSTSIARRAYGTSITYENPLSDIIKKVTGGSGQYYDDDHPAIKAVREELHAEQLQRMRRATTFDDALQAAKPLGEIKFAQSGYDARVDLPKKAIAILWAKARQQGILGEKINEHLLNGRGSYFIKNGHNQIHQALLEMANSSGHDDLVHAIADAGIRHHKGADHAAALNGLAQGFAHSVDKVAAMQKLADAAGMMDRKRNQGFVGGALVAPSWNKEEGEQTIRDKLSEMLEEAQKREQGKVK